MPHRVVRVEPPEDTASPAPCQSAAAALPTYIEPPNSRATISAANVDRGGKMPLRSGAGAGRIRGAGPALLSPVKDLGQEGQEERAAWQQEYEDDGHHLG